jgi:hypothetical protein
VREVKLVSGVGAGHISSLFFGVKEGVGGGSRVTFTVDLVEDDRSRDAVWICGRWL